MATSPNYGWLEPDNTDLVKNGALAIRTLGNAIDTTMATMTPKSIVDAKGDLIAASANDTPARLAVGNNGETLVADSSTSTGLRWQGNFAAGKNKVINGDFGIWQRGTSFSTNVYNADRWINGSDASVTITRETFTAGTAPVAGYEGTYFCKVAKSAGGSYANQEQRIEDVRTFAGQTVTLSFWAKAGASFSLEPAIVQSFGSGGSPAVVLYGTPVTLTTSWARYSFTVTLASISGKTIGAGSYLAVNCVRMPTSSAVTIDIWGVQLEAGSVATAFQTATGTIQGELAACQRYYYRTSANNSTTFTTVGNAYSTTNAVIETRLPVTMRVTPTAVDFTTLQIYSLTSGGQTAATGVSLNAGNGDVMEVIATVSSGLTSGHIVNLRGNGSGAYLGFSAEL